MLFKKIITTIASMTRKDQNAPWWAGVPTKLIKKTTLVPPAMNSLPVHTLTFAIPDADHPGFDGPAIHHSKLRLDLGDVVKMVIPGYKPKSYSVSALREKEFDVTFKVYPNGRASGPLDRLQIGDTIGSFGKSANRRRNPGNYVGIVVFGVGITEGLPVARAELNDGSAEKVVLLWASRTTHDTFWKDEIQSLCGQYPDQFEMVRIFSREAQEGCLQGRVNQDVLKKVFQPANAEEARFLSVGTKEMMRQTEAMWADLGYKLPHNLLLPKIKEKL